MGRAIMEAAAGRNEVLISALVDRADSDVAGRVIGGLTVTANPAAGFAVSDVYIDFTTPAATHVLAAAAATGKAIAAVIGTTGLGPTEEAAIAGLAAVAPVVVAANFSLGVNIVLGVAQQIAKILGPDWDAEVVETHHRAKRDAPSGTALAIARAIAAGHGVAYDSVKRHSRDGDIGPRPRGEIGVSTVRGGDVVGEHTATFYGAGERIELGHRASSRSIFAVGALRAAAWVVGQPPGRYDMLDVLGLR